MTKPPPETIDLPAAEWEPGEVPPAPVRPVPYWLAAAFVVFVIALLR